LTETNEQYDKKEQEVVNLAGQITAPFKTEELGWTSTDGKQSGTVVLSNRMKKLQKTVDVEEKELIRQWDEWVDSEAELDQLAAEVAAPAVAGNVHTYLALSADEREMMDEIKAEVDRFQKMMKEAAEASLKAMKESEKVCVFAAWILPRLLISLSLPIGIES